MSSLIYAQSLDKNLQLSPLRPEIFVFSFQLHPWRTKGGSKEIARPDTSIQFIGY